MEYLDALEPWMIPIVVMVCVTLIVIVTSAAGIMKAALRRKEGKNLSENQEFLDALREFKESIDHRVTRLEKMTPGAKTGPSSEKSGKEKRSNQSAVKLELDSDGDSSLEEKTAGNTGLRNMLNQ